MYGADRKWKVKVDNPRRTLVSVEIRSAAMDYAKYAEKIRYSDLYIHHKNGKVYKKINYGKIV